MIAFKQRKQTILRLDNHMLQCLNYFTKNHISVNTPSQKAASSSSFPMLHRTSSRPDFVLKSSCGDLQSRLKVRKVLGVGDASGSTCTSKITQILGQADNFINLPPKLAAWLLAVTTFFSCFTVLGIIWPACLRLILPGDLESTVHLATSYAFLATILGLTLRSGDKTSLQLVLFSLALFHSLSLFIALWLFKTGDTKIKSTISIIFHLSCLLINTHFYRLINRLNSPTIRPNKLRTYFHSMISFPSPSMTDINNGHESS